ncbi:hypothetical protein AB6A40_006975 [Gnathostoma spinigerum]|uniref:ubiquitinyl hydrolase 1 n=1 Tax=Gnathostoma spinigerum TaxID=75299 RepID=A0ABD6ELX2_9BILA
MDAILFEKQEASLCAQHALNMLLQGSYFTAVDLSEIAHQLDQRENGLLDVLGSHSNNMDDSGQFSVQVIAEALKPFSLELVPLSSPRSVRYREDPTLGNAYICNLAEHWFAVRRIGFQWFNLNSLLPSPKLISDTYLSLFFAQLANDGYSIFVVEGSLPSCSADEILTQCPVDPNLACSSQPLREEFQEDPDLARALALSLGQECVANDDSALRQVLQSSRDEFDSSDHSLQQVLRESMRNFGNPVTDEDDEMDRQFQCALQASLSETAHSSNLKATDAGFRTSEAISKQTEERSSESPATVISLNNSETQLNSSSETQQLYSSDRQPETGSRNSQTSYANATANDFAAQTRQNRAKFLERFS